ncbi:MAG: hypothetical protein PHT69_15705 [Bacteroidales bacterium]|nr:hypothetical protein [Bacteroidales bacterium]
MGFFNFFKQKTKYEKLLSMVGPMLVEAYRNIAKERGLAPTSKTSDKKIIEIYLSVEAAFKNAASQRNETLGQENINYIAFFFYQVYEGYEGDLCDVLFQNQLDYEIKKYIKEGLPKRFQQELVLFETE